MFAVVYIPNFALQSILRLEPELHSRPVVLVENKSTKPLILETNQAASDAEVCAGMTATQALARCNGLIFKTALLAQENTAREILLRCSYSISPRIESTADGVCTIDLKGTRNDPGEVIAQLVQFHLRAQIGVAETPDLALLAARSANPLHLVTAVSDRRTFLNELPVSALETFCRAQENSANIFSILKKWGIRSVGQFAALDGNEMAARLGHIAHHLWQRARGQMRPLKLIKPAEVFEESIEFEHEIELLEPLLFMLRRFLEQLSMRLALVYLVAEKITLALTFSDDKKFERVFKIPSPTRNVDLLFRMLHTRLEKFRADSAITAMHLHVKPCRPANEQFGLFETALRDPNQFYETLARLSALVGADRVGTPDVEETLRPDAAKTIPVSVAAISDRRTNDKCDGRRPPLPVAGLTLRRFRPPLPARVLLNESEPAFVAAADLNEPITDARGPFYSSGDWWEQNRWERIEWDVETASGGLYRIFQDQENWFLEGEYD